MFYEEYYIWLQQVFGQGSRRVDEILSVFPNAKEFYDNRNDAYSVLSGFKKSEETRIKNCSLDFAEKIFYKYKKLGVSIITPDDPRYPNRLRNIIGMPAVLYMVGTLDNIDSEVVVSVVGTRKETLYGRTAAEKISYELAAGGAIVVSGLALGIDSAAHRGALKANGRTIGFLACGLDVDYPKENAELKRKMCDNGGAVITEYPSGASPLPGNFPVRNRLLSGISLGTLIVEAPEKSGAMITANMALEQGKDVFAVFGNIFEDRHGGNNKLIKDGAKPISSGADILQEYLYLYPRKIDVEKASVSSIEFRRPMDKQLLVADKNNSQSIYKTKKDNINTKSREEKNNKNSSEDDAGDVSEEQAIAVIMTKIKALNDKTAEQICSCLSFEPKNIEEISQLINEPTKNILSKLTELEIDGVVLSHSGRRFSLAKLHITK